MARGRKLVLLDAVTRTHYGAGGGSDTGKSNHQGLRLNGINADAKGT